MKRMRWERTDRVDVLKGNRLFPKLGATLTSKSKPTAEGASVEKSRMVLCTHVMRTALALLVLSWGGANCLAAPPTPKWCSYGFDQGDKHAELVFFRGDPELRLQDKTVKLAEQHGSWEEAVIFATINFWAEGIE